MQPEVFLCWGGVVCALLVAGLAAWRWERGWGLFWFLLGMAGFALQGALGILSRESAEPQRLLALQRWQWASGALLPGIWLAFSLGFAKSGAAIPSRAWRWTLAGLMGIPSVLAFPWADLLFTGQVLKDLSWGWFLPIGWPGKLFVAVTLLGWVLGLANLERTIRVAAGRARWQVKFLVFGLGGLAALQVYTGGQALLFGGADTILEQVNGLALLPASLSLGVGVWRCGVREVRIQLSHSALYHSLTFLVVGIYFLLAGAAAQLLVLLGALEGIHYKILFVFLVVCGAGAVLFSDRVRYRVRKIVRQNFLKSRYDYREVWSRFTQSTAGLTEPRALCREAARFLAETLEALSVSVWLLEEREGSLRLAASTVYPEGESLEVPLGLLEAGELLSLLAVHPFPVVDLEGDVPQSLADWKASASGFLQDAMVRYCVPLVAARRLLGMVTVGERIRWVPLAEEDKDLLRTLVDQLAMGLAQSRLSEELREARELEAFQSMAAFLVHDLKNLSAKLALTAQNLPEYFQEPEFREDAVRVITQSVEKIKAMCSQLSLTREGLQVRPQEVDPRELLRQSLKELDGVLRAEVVQELGEVPTVRADPELMKRVLVNLLLNANEAVSEKGRILVGAWAGGGCVVLRVEDDGKGIPREFMEKSLFRPFRTSKPGGMGIGLFQCKTMVEAQGGRIEVESQEGKGTRVRVVLPVATSGC